MITETTYTPADLHHGKCEWCGEELFPDMVPGKLPEPVEIIIKRKKNG